MTTGKLNKHELRTRETRELLLKSAETIFVRDGYEGAELGEIAALAGRTKGAIYAHFKSKEDIFLALIEERARSHREQMEKLLAVSTSQEENLATYRKFCLSLLEDQAWTLLLLDYKLYALRHPESKERLQLHYETVLPVSSEKKYAQLLGAPPKGPDVLSRYVAIQAMQPLLSALTVEAKFAPASLEPEVLRKLASSIFDALLPPPINK